MEPYGDALAQEVIKRYHLAVVSTTALIAIPKSDRSDNIVCAIASVGGFPQLSMWIPGSTAVVDSVGVFVPTDISTSVAYIADPTTAPGRWIIFTSSAGTSAPDASTSLKGVVKLAGDLGGTAALPSVLKVNGAAVPVAGSLTTGNAAYASGSSALTYSALNLAGGSGWVANKLPLANTTMQSGTGTLGTGGTVTIAATITASSRIKVTMKDPGAGAITGFAALTVPVAARVVGAPGSFDVTAIDDSKAAISAARCTFDWFVEG